MPRQYAKISMSLWRSQKFRSLRTKDRPRLLYFYLHTCAQANSTGCFACPIGYMSADLGWGDNQIAEAIESLCEAQLIDWNANEEVVRVVGFLDHDPPTNPNHAKAVVQVALELPDCEQKRCVLSDLLKNEHVGPIEILRPEYERLVEAFPEGIGTTVPYPSPSPRPAPSLRSGGRARCAPRRAMPEDWPSGPDREKAIAYWRKAGREDLVPQLETEAEKAQAHHRGKGTRSPDWSAVWTTWYTRALSFNRQPHGNRHGKPTAHENFAAGSFLAAQDFAAKHGPEN